MVRWTLSLGLVLAACQSAASTPTEHVLALREVGVLPSPPGSAGRDGGASVSFGGHSAWVFGDTFLAEPAADGYQWRASSWSWTDDADASDGLDGWHHAVGADGKPLQLIPHTADEQAFDDAHNGAPCPAATDCGARRTAWPGAVVADASRGALLFYSKENTEPTGSFSFTGTGASVAVWPSPDGPAIRTQVANGPNPLDPTELFGADEPPWGAAAIVADDMLFVWACPGGGLRDPCDLARVPVAQVLDRSSWRFWTGSGWDGDWHKAVHTFDGAPIMSVHLSEYLGSWVAFYLVPLSTALAMRVAPSPEGPWSDEERFGEGAVPGDGSWDYGLVAHHELARDGGRVEYLSYFQPGRFFDGAVHLVEITFR